MVPPFRCRPGPGVLAHRRGHCIGRVRLYSDGSGLWVRSTSGGECSLSRRQVFADELVGAAEIAERLGLAHAQAVHTWRRRYPAFPQPVTKLKQAMIWAWPDVEAWAKATGRI